MLQTEHRRAMLGSCVIFCHYLYVRRNACKFKLEKCCLRSLKANVWIEGHLDTRFELMKSMNLSVSSLLSRKTLEEWRFLIFKSLTEGSSIHRAGPSLLNMTISHKSSLPISFSAQHKLCYIKHSKTTAPGIHAGYVSWLADVAPGAMFLCLIIPFSSS